MSVPPTDARFAEAQRRFDLIHQADPRTVLTPTGPRPLAVAHHQGVAAWVARLAPEASPALRLAAGCQHLGRYAMPRTDFPEGVLGYKRWRVIAAQRHAAEAEAILRDVGWEDETVARVRELLTKKGLGRDPEVQSLEDAVCLTFLEVELLEFAAKHTAEKVDDILTKTWGKMSPAGRAHALAMLSEAQGEVAAIAARLAPRLTA